MQLLRVFFLPLCNCKVAQVLHQQLQKKALFHGHLWPLVAPVLHQKLHYLAASCMVASLYKATPQLLPLGAVFHEGSRNTPISPCSLADRKWRLTVDLFTFNSSAISI